MFFCPGVTAAVFLPSFPLFSTFCWPRLWAVGVSKCSRSIHVSTGHGCLLDQSIYLATQQRFLEKKKAAQHRRWTADEAGTKAATTLGDTTSNLFGLFWRLWLYFNVLNSFKSYPIPFHSFQRITTSTITSLHGRDSADVDLVQDFRPGEGSRSRQNVKAEQPLETDTVKWLAWGEWESYLFIVLTLSHSQFTVTWSSGNSYKL